MYKLEPFTADLMQGDIVKDLHLLGALNLNNIGITKNFAGDVISWNYSNAAVFGYAMVVSHSCEISRENKDKLTSLILAPIRSVDSATSKDKIAELIKTNKLSLSDGSSFLKYYYLESHESIPENKTGSVVDFSKIFSLHKNCYDFLLKNRVIQLDRDEAKEISIKLGVYFSRT